MSANYWNETLHRQVSRRRVIASTGGLAVSAALLAACGSSGSKTVSDKSDAVNKVSDTTKQAKVGGTYKYVNTDEPRSWDPYPSGIGTTSPRQVYSRLLRIRNGVMKASAGEIDGELAESWEFNADRTQLTFKLRPDTKWDTRAPTNGRIADSSDVLFSWERFLKVSALRGNYANSVNPLAPIQSLSAPDSRTVVFKLAFPDAGLETLLAISSTRVLHILPKEADGGFDVRQETRGTGPYTLAEWRASSDFVWQRNPNFYDKSFPFIDRIENPIIPEYATALSQLKAGRIYGMDVPGEDILQTKADAPALLLYENDVTVQHGKTFYGWQDGAKSPFRDERVRQAFSMSLDRELWIDTFYNVQKFEASGLPIETRWNSGIAATAEGWWLDPRGKDFGENAKYYKHDVAEAKKLMSAAGFANGTDADAHYVLTNQYGRDFPNMVQVMLGMAQEAGLRLKTVPADYNIDWDPKYRAAKPPGNFDGLAFINMTLSEEPGTWLFSVYNSKGDLFKGFDPDGKSNFGGDPAMEELTKKLKTEFDPQKRWAVAHDLQRLEAKKQYMTPLPGGASGFLLAWPALKNFRVHRGGSYPGPDPYLDPYLWVDPTQAPLKQG